MTLNQSEFEAILQDTSKTIQGDILWQQHPQHNLLFKFKAEIVCDLETYSLSLRGTCNPLNLCFELPHHLSALWQDIWSGFGQDPQEPGWWMGWGKT